MAETKFCEVCAKSLDEIIQKRIRAILAIADEEGTEEERGIAETQCFHLMEIQSILRGQKTCGVYDDVPEPTISGPLFDRR